MLRCRVSSLLFRLGLRFSHHVVSTDLQHSLLLAPAFTVQDYSIGVVINFDPYVLRTPE
jgi:hypothetical protein